METPIITTHDLRTRLAHRPEMQLLDVRLEPDFEAAHLPGAMHQCVFEVGFLPAIRARINDRQTLICVYGHGPDSYETRMACAKLLREGYANTMDYREGLQGWVAAGGELEQGPPVNPTPTPTDGTYALDLVECRIEWLGRNLLNKHWGTIAIQQGTVILQAGKPEGGELVIDMTDLVCTDLVGDPLHDVLIDHLKSDDFFDVQNYPTCTYTITGSTRLQPDQPGRTNLRLDGVLSLKDVRAPLSIDLCTGLTPDGRFAAQGAFRLDRTRWNVLYGSGQFFERLGGHLVNDTVELQLRLLCGASLNESEDRTQS